MVLLDILSSLTDVSLHHRKHPLLLRAIHVNHQLNKQSNKWAKFCAQQCKIRNVPFIIYSIKTKKTNNTEEIYRYERYKILYNNLLKNEVLVTAHHLDDQVETLFLALKRGSGPTGLASMPENICFGKYRLLRPFLNFHKQQIKDYAKKNNINWVEDSSNKDISYDRNFLRLNILPLLNKRWPSFNDVVARTAKLCAEQEILINELLSRDLASLILIDGSLKIKELFFMSFIKRKALLRRWLANHNIKMPSFNKLNIIWQEIVLSRLDSMPKLKLDDKYLCRYNNCLHLLSEKILSSVKYTKLIWQSKIPLLLPQELGIVIKYIEFFKRYISFNTQISMIDYIYNKYDNHHFSNQVIVSCMVRAPSVNEQVSIHIGSYNNSLLKIVNRNHRRKLKKIWQELKVPPWLRKKIPLLFYNETLIAGLGTFITKEGQMQKENIFWKVCWLRAPSSLLLINRLYKN